MPLEAVQAELRRRRLDYWHCGRFTLWDGWLKAAADNLEMPTNFQRQENGYHIPLPWHVWYIPLKVQTFLPPFSASNFWYRISSSSAILLTLGWGLDRGWQLIVHTPWGLADWNSNRPVSVSIYTHPCAVQRLKLVSGLFSLCIEYPTLLVIARSHFRIELLFSELFVRFFLLPWLLDLHRSRSCTLCILYLKSFLKWLRPLVFHKCGSNLLCR